SSAWRRSGYRSPRPPDRTPARPDASRRNLRRETARRRCRARRESGSLRRVLSHHCTGQTHVWALADAKRLDECATSYASTRPWIESRHAHSILAEGPLDGLGAGLGASLLAILWRAEFPVVLRPWQSNNAGRALAG